MAKARRKSRYAPPAATPAEPSVPRPLALPLDPQVEKKLLWVIASGLFLFGVYIAIVYYGQQPVPNSDFPTYSDTARDLWSFHMPDRFKRLPALGTLHLFFSLLIPGHSALLQAGWLVNAILYPFNCVLLFLVGRQILGNSPGALCFAMIAAMNSVILLLLIQPLTETAMIFCGLLSVYLILRRSWWCYLPCFCFSMVRYEGAAMILTALIADLILRESLRQRLISLGLAVLTGIPLLAWLIGASQTGKQNSHGSLLFAAAIALIVITLGLIALWLRRPKIGAATVIFVQTGVCLALGAFTLWKIPCIIFAAAGPLLLLRQDRYRYGAYFAAMLAAFCHPGGLFALIMLAAFEALGRPISWQRLLPMGVVVLTAVLCLTVSGERYMKHLETLPYVKQFTGGYRGKWNQWAYTKLLSKTTFEYLLRRPGNLSDELKARTDFLDLPYDQVQEISRLPHEEQEEALREIPLATMRNIYENEQTRVEARSKFNQLQTIVRWIAGILCAIGIFYAALRRDWKMLVPLIFLTCYVVVHSLRHVSQPRYTVPVLWLTLLLGCYGLRSLWYIVRADRWMPAIGQCFGQIVLLAAGGLWSLLLMRNYFDSDLARLSQTTYNMGVFLVAAAVLIGLGGTIIYFRRPRPWLPVAALLALTLTVLMSNHSAIVYRVGNGDHDREFRLLADWVRTETKTGERIATTMPQVLSLLAPERTDDFRHTDSFTHGELEPLEDIVPRLRQADITYFAWDSRIGRYPSNNYYKAWGIPTLQPLSKGEDVGSFQYLTTLKVNYKQYIHLYRLREASPSENTSVSENNDQR